MNQHFRHYIVRNFRSSGVFLSAARKQKGSFSCHVYIVKVISRHLGLYGCKLARMRIRIGTKIDFLFFRKKYQNLKVHLHRPLPSLLFTCKVRKFMPYVDPEKSRWQKVTQPARQPTISAILRAIYTVNHKKWQNICDHNSRKSWWIFIIFALL